MFSGQKFLITGANGGIGIELSKVFLKNNAKLILLYNENRDQIDNLLTKYPDYSSSVEIYKINLLVFHMTELIRSIGSGKWIFNSS